MVSSLVLRNTAIVHVHGRCNTKYTWHHQDSCRSSQHERDLYQGRKRGRCCHACEDFVRPIFDTSDRVSLCRGPQRKLHKLKSNKNCTSNKVGDTRYAFIFSENKTVSINPIRSGLFQTANDPGGGL